ncbi:MAG: hypothetical protein MRZ57_08150, partial [Bacteroidales bacterium]|nr:hypothetical protein [Bacteroidales bacterium]
FGFFFIEQAHIMCKQKKIALYKPHSIIVLYMPDDCSSLAFGQPHTLCQSIDQGIGFHHRDHIV